MVSIFGIKIYTERKQELLRLIEDILDKRTPTQIITLNTLMIEEALKNPSFMKILRKNRLNIIDSVGIQIYILLKYGFLPQRIPGIELMEDIIRIGVRKGLRFYFLGSREYVNRKAVNNLKKKFRNLIVSGRRNGYFENEDEVVEDIRNKKTDILFVGLNIPYQEIWIERNLKKTKVLLAIGIGGSFDVISGRLRRAPDFLRKIGFEWFFRFIQQPWRIKRIIKLPRFLLRILVEFLK